VRNAGDGFAMTVWLVSMTKATVNYAEIVRWRKQMKNEKEIKLEDHERTRCEIWTRVMGYFRPVHCMNAGKQQEYKDRKFYKVEGKFNEEEKQEKRDHNNDPGAVGGDDPGNGGAEWEEAGDICSISGRNENCQVGSSA